MSLHSVSANLTKKDAKGIDIYTYHLHAHGHTHNKTHIVFTLGFLVTVSVYLSGSLELQIWENCLIGPEEQTDFSEIQVVKGFENTIYEE